ncbi:MAG: hypothetical protein HY784_03275 [Chloroflexi bacterium]|nr:hypothetical protein [Chloroflexota bacterium]
MNQLLLLNAAEAGRRRRALHAFEAAVAGMLSCSVCRKKVLAGPLRRELECLQRELAMTEAFSSALRQDTFLLASPN